MKNCATTHSQRTQLIVHLCIVGLAGTTAQAIPTDGTGAVEVTGELKRWHKVTLTLDGPFAHEQSVDRQMDVRFTHESGTPDYQVPGYFAADGHAAETSAEEGTTWRAHLSPDKTGAWTYTVQFTDTPYDKTTGTFQVAASDKTGRDLRGKGRLQTTGSRYLRFAGNREWFLKAGADAPETFLAYADFDGTVATKPAMAPLKTWEAHIRDWKPGDPTWKDGKGKGMIGAINYLAGTGCNAFSFLPYNAGGDGDNVWPHVSRDDKLHFDGSKLDQWGIVFDHATTRGMFLHFKLQETENDDLRGKNEEGKTQALDQGDLGPERKAYVRELIARFGHNLALNWNLGEECTLSTEQVSDMARYIRQTDPYGHLVVLHTYPNQQDKIYGAFLGKPDMLTGVSIQNSNVADTHRDVLKWVSRSEASGHPWVVAMDEAGTAETGSPPDPDWPGMARALKQVDSPTVDQVRAQVLWGSLMAGGTGTEYYFGYKLPENDLVCENWRSRAKTWASSAIALEFFQTLPFWEMSNDNARIGNAENDNRRYCFSKEGEIYVIYLANPGPVELDLTHVDRDFNVHWFNPRTGGELLQGSIKQIPGGAKTSLGAPPSSPNQDWIVLVK